MAETVTSWDTYAASKPQRRAVNAAGQRTWFNWTQYPDHGPGEDLLAPSPDAVMLDLGCGKAGNAAHLATLGIQVTGVDVSPVQLAAARERWPDLAGLHLHCGDALEFLSTDDGEWDAIFSVFGAVWFTDPARLLPVVFARLRPGGRFVFSHRPPIPGCYGCQAGFIQRGTDDADPHVIRRWDYSADMWAHLLASHGFVTVAAEMLPPPEGKESPGTMLVQAFKPSGP